MTSLLTELPLSENVVCSPLSVRTALAMLLPGARGDTREQLERFVGTEALYLPSVYASESRFFAWLGC